MPEMVLQSIGPQPGHFATAAANTAVAITFQPTRARHEFAGTVVWSYSEDPTAGRLTITGGGFNFDIDITSGGPGFIPFQVPMHAMDDAPIVFTLAAGGGTCVGKLNILGARFD